MILKIDNNVGGWLLFYYLFCFYGLVDLDVLKEEEGLFKFSVLKFVDFVFGK